MTEHFFGTEGNLISAAKQAHPIVRQLHILLEFILNSKMYSPSFVLFLFNSLLMERKPLYRVLIPA